MIFEIVIYRCPGAWVLKIVFYILQCLMFQNKKMMRR